MNCATSPNIHPNVHSTFCGPNAKILFWTPKPSEISYWDWLFHPDNPHRFPDWVNDLLASIKKLSQITGRTWCYQRFLATRFGKSVRWIREILHRLETIGVLEIIRDRQNRYRVNPQFQAAHNQSCRNRGGNPPSSGGNSSPTSGENPTDLPIKDFKTTNYKDSPGGDALHGSIYMDPIVINRGEGEVDDELSDAKVTSKIDTGAPDANRRPVKMQKLTTPDNENLETATQIVAIRQQLHRLGKCEPVNNPGGYARHLSTHDPAILKTEHDRQRSLLDAAHRERAALAVGTYVPTTTETEPTPTDHTPGRQWDKLHQTEQLDWVLLAEERHPEIKRMAKQRSWPPALLRETLWARAERMFFEHQCQQNPDGDGWPTEPMTNDEGHNQQWDNGCERQPSRWAPDELSHHQVNLQPSQIRRDDFPTRSTRQTDPG